MSRPVRPTAAFSLVEVTLALGIMAFCLVAVFGLLPTGLNTSRDAIAQSAAANIAGALVADLRQTPLATVAVPNPQSPRFLVSVPSLTDGTPVIHTLFFREDGSVATSTPATSAQDVSADFGQNPQYRATVVFSWHDGANGKSLVTDHTATAVRILITWPALSDPAGGSLPKKANSFFETMVALDRN